MRVLLACAGGMSTSMLMRKMEAYAAEHGIDDFHIDAVGIAGKTTTASSWDRRWGTARAR